MLPVIDRRQSKHVLSTFTVLMATDKCVFYHAVSSPQWNSKPQRELFIAARRCWWTTLTEVVMKQILLTVKPRRQMEEEADWCLGGFPKVLFDPWKLSHLRSLPLTRPLFSSFDPLLDSTRCVSSVWICRDVCGPLWGLGIYRFVVYVLCGWVS